jgi:AAA+ superfamily predicted ATPase
MYFKPYNDDFLSYYNLYNHYILKREFYNEAIIYRNTIDFGFYNEYVKYTLPVNISIKNPLSRFSLDVDIPPPPPPLPPLPPIRSVITPKRPRIPRRNNIFSHIDPKLTPFTSSILNMLIPPTKPKLNEIKLPEKEDRTDKMFYTIDEKISDLDELIQLGKLYDTKYEKLSKDHYFGLNLKKLSKVVEPLEKLSNLIGMTDVKQHVFELVIYYIQELDYKNKDMLHTIIEGPPGVGKTELAKILGQIYSKMGILSKGTFKSIKITDLKGGYLGQTALKTRDLLDSCKGGVIFFDEAYSIGNPQLRDSYSKEALDIICAYLEENKGDFVMIIAGYKEALKKCFFAYNEGLERRFNWRFEIDKYSPEEMKQIFFKKVRDHNWKIDEKSIKTAFFDKNKDFFKFSGGDMETLFHRSKMAHSKRVLTLNPDKKKLITQEDIENGFKIFITNDEIQKRNDKSALLAGLYV